MSNLGNKDVFANNLKKYMQLNGKSRSMCWMQEKNKTIDYIFANMKGRPPTNSQFLTQMYYHIQRCRN